MSVLTLEALPNELLHCVLSYLHSDEIVCSFLDVNMRFYSLCLPYIERLNLATTKTSVQLWSVQSGQLIPPLVKTLKLNDTQLDWTFDSPADLPTSFPQLRAVHLRVLLQNEHYKHYLPIFKRTLPSLIVDYQNATLFSRIDHEILDEFIVEGCSTVLSELTIDGVCLSIDSENFQVCHTLRRLTLSVEYQHHLFVLLEYLPQLEYLNVAIREGKAGTYDYNYARTEHLSLQLRELIICGNDIDFSDLDLLVRQCRSTLQVLKLRLKVDYIIDGRMLEPWKEFLKRFDFYFFCHSLGDALVPADDLLSSFQTDPWLPDQSVMFFNNTFYQTCTIVSPPSHCRAFNCSLTNEFMNCRLNREGEQLRMPRIRRVFLNDKQQPVYTDRFFRVLRSVFANLRILEIGSSFRFVDDDEDDNSHARTEVAQLPSVSTLIAVNNQDHGNVRRLLRRLPHLSRLVIDYDVLVASTRDVESIEQRDQLREILITFQPNEHVEVDDELKDRVRSVYGNAKILS